MFHLLALIGNFWNLIWNIFPVKDLAFGGDSNASGVAALIELARLFSRLASQPGQNGLSRFNLVFAVTGGGKLNFLGSKKFLEDQLDGVDGGLFQVGPILMFNCPSWRFAIIADNFQDTVYALCLDSLGKGGELNVHVSKPPKEGSNSAAFIEVGNNWPVYPLNFGTVNIPYSTGSSDDQPNPSPRGRGEHGSQENQSGWWFFGVGTRTIFDPATNGHDSFSLQGCQISY